MRLIYSVLFIMTVLLSSCGGKKNSQMNFDTIVWSDDIYSENVAIADDRSVAIPYVERNGVKYVPVRINGAITIDMVVDTGCSGVMISINEAQRLVEAGLLSDEDYIGNSLSSIADGSIVDNMVFNIDEMVIGNEVTCSNVEVSVSNSITAPMLLGNAVFDRVSSITIDNTNRSIIFHL